MERSYQIESARIIVPKLLPNPTFGTPIPNRSVPAPYLLRFSFARVPLKLSSSFAL